MTVDSASGGTTGRSDPKADLDGVSGEYIEPTPDRVVDQKLFEYISDYVIGRLEGTRVLELGVGDQAWTSKLLERFPDVTTVDGSARLLDVARRHLQDNSRWTPVHALFEEYTPDEPFDLVLATYVLEHVDSVEAILERARQHWLVPGGRIAVAVPHALSLHRRLAVTMGLANHVSELGETDARMGHRRCMTWQELEADLVNAGFEVVERKGLFTKALPNSALTACTDEQLKGLVELGLELPIEYSATIYFQARVKS